MLIVLGELQQRTPGAGCVKSRLEVATVPARSLNTLGVHWLSPSANRISRDGRIFSRKEHSAEQSKEVQN